MGILSDLSIEKGKTDLHIHTNCSDGALTPSEIVMRYKKNGFETIAITDHDTVSGVSEALDAGRALGLRVIPGIEISTEWGGGLRTTAAAAADRDACVEEAVCGGCSEGKLCAPGSATGRCEGDAGAAVNFSGGSRRAPGSAAYRCEGDAHVGSDAGGAESGCGGSSVESSSRLSEPIHKNCDSCAKLGNRNDDDAASINCAARGDATSINCAVRGDASAAVGNAAAVAGCDVRADEDVRGGGSGELLSRLGESIHKNCGSCAELGNRNDDDAASINCAARGDAHVGSDAGGAATATAAAGGCDLRADEDVSGGGGWNGLEAHILGYGFDLENEALSEMLARFMDERRARNEKLLACLNAQGYPLTYDELLIGKRGGYIGKPDFGRAMARRGYIASPADVFAPGRFLESPEAKKIKKWKIDTREAVRLITEAGGDAVLAHPIQIKELGAPGSSEYYERLVPFINELKKYGLKGLEVYHPDQSDAESEIFLRMARELGLIPTRGSDFHGDDFKKRQKR